MAGLRSGLSTEHPLMRALLIAVVAVMVSACVAPPGGIRVHPDKVAQLKIGMERPEIVALIGGEPNAEEAYRGETHLWWVFFHVEMSPIWVGSIHQEFLKLILIDGKASSWTHKYPPDTVWPEQQNFSDRD
jgi:outer membrane protein assembly factor BamE (lipoprotein component of BamABCDE complex)